MNREKLKELNKKYGNSKFFQCYLRQELQILNQFQSDKQTKRRILKNG